ncbi:hypothetical protein BX616_000802 [Lobosporangium transversale]|uniref:Swiss Army Knife RNA repair protein HAD domain-containing protein n=1 Tax=Lobosporangium transversale TaxID=64571 RepID=A0A1Y2GV05_9FUNG|nr:hypothetical protein BCR41DRAFT_420141 [Lobosporangium transversale]KAF9917496.1 hypothetical protein BX616_000802 [Lobosporangium transversale]ORZ24891.1 hypothetical protein BCR41DRAFT_420141 [Lobosporangium transversale]|eukprot:XP_021883872.1 hypothetical protein BCR41DRAFT_420141 [Lobosporangium transversale]
MQSTQTTIQSVTSNTFTPSVTIAASSNNSSNDLITTTTTSSSLFDHPCVVFAKDWLRHGRPETTRLTKVHVFDFDQTLFRSSLPNPALWDASFIGHLISWNTCGPGWWQHPGTLDLGPEAEASSYDGWWNEELIVEVEKSIKDEECLTILLTGRNTLIYKERLIQIVQSKRLEFDLIAMKPCTAARLEPRQDFKNSNAGSSRNDNRNNKCTNIMNHKIGKRKHAKTSEVYLKVHTFNVKQEFLYNVLYEYPTIQHMRIWDDRAGQIQKFRVAGQQWQRKGLLKEVEVIEVNISHRYMDPEWEKKLVYTMVDAHNQQADIEAKGGAFWVSGVGIMPKSRFQELEDEGIWNPIETYIPQKRAHITIESVVQYTGVQFEEGIQSILKRSALQTPREPLEEKMNELKNQSESEIKKSVAWIPLPKALQGQDTSRWDIPTEFHVTLCLGAAVPEFQEVIGGLGATVLVEIEAVGELEGKLWALKVRGLEDRDMTDQTEMTESTAEITATEDGERKQSITGDGTNMKATMATKVTIIAPNGEIYSTFKSFFSALYSTMDPSTMRYGRVVSRKGTTPHITMAMDRFRGMRPSMSNKVTEWESIHPTSTRRIILVGTIAQKRLLGIKLQRLGHLAAVPRPEVSIAEIVKVHAVEKSIDLPGRDLGQIIKQVQHEMVRLSIENKTVNIGLITALVHSTFDMALGNNISATAKK